jgi:hypothetical protein
MWNILHKSGEMSIAMSGGALQGTCELSQRAGLWMSVNRDILRRYHILSTEKDGYGGCGTTFGMEGARRTAAHPSALMLFNVCFITDGSC